MRRKCCWFSFSLCCSPACFLKEDENFFFLHQTDFKSAHGKKISPALSAPFVWNNTKGLTFFRKFTRATHTHTHFKHETVRSLLPLLFLRRRIGAHSLSLSLFFFFNSSSRSVLSRGDDIQRINEYIWINFYNGFDVWCVSSSSPQFLWNDGRRARARLFSFLYFSCVSLSKKNVVL